MFTGIIEELAKIQKITRDSITVECKNILDDIHLGDSVAVNGVCLTVTEIYSDGYSADISPETMKVTALGYLNSGDFVNLERALPANGRFGGHIVSGHIDGIGKLLNINKEGSFFEMRFELPKNLSNYTITKGSIAINGISLTIAETKENIIKTAIIPHTFENTNLKYLKTGDYVNIEADIFAKYVEKFLSTRDNESRVNMSLLQENGFLG